MSERSVTLFATLPNALLCLRSDAWYTQRQIRRYIARSVSIGGRDGLLHFLRIGLVMVCLSGLVDLEATAQTPTYDVHPDYLVKHFNVEDGLPVNAVTGLVQGDDGYLWMTTFDGLVRFDGHRFTVFNTDNSPGMLSNRFRELVSGPDGGLWAGTEAGFLTHYEDGVFTNFDEDDGVPARVRILSLQGDTLWILTKKGAAFWTEGTLQPFLPEVQGFIRTIAPDSAGSVWAGSADEPVIYHARADGTVQDFTIRDGLPSDFKTRLLHVDHRGVLWAALRTPEKTGMLYRLQKGRFEQVAIPHVTDSLNFNTLESTPDGTLWIGTPGHGWLTYRDGRVASVPALEQGA